MYILIHHRRRIDRPPVLGALSFGFGNALFFLRSLAGSLNCWSMKYEITKSFRFDSAHSLPNLCDGHQCKRLHGHSYELIVGVSGPIENEWVQDYADISAVVSPLVKRLDHQFLNDILPFITTAENLAAFFWRELEPALPLISRIEIRETATSNVILTK